VDDALTYVGHATLLLELSGRRVLTDPLLRSGVGYVRRRARAPRLEDLTELDAILVSHAHHDHLDPPSLRLVGHDCPVVVPRGCASLARRSGVREVVEMAPGERVKVADMWVEGVSAHHDGRRYPVGRPVAAMGFLLEGSVSVYFAGDTDLFPEMSRLAGRVDVATLPVWGWGPRLPRGHLDPRGAARAVALIRPRIAVPIHWGTLAAPWAQRGADPLAPPRAFASAVAELAPEVDVMILSPGERGVLSDQPARSTPNEGS
jgi:L-ascorbate metabolism protein UlaG (beta-lactamase superfamily)